MGQRTTVSRIRQHVFIASLSLFLSVFASGNGLAKEPAAVKPALTNHPAYELMQQLDKRADVRLEDVPLTEAIEKLRKRYKLPLILDAAALDISGINPETIVTLEAKNIQARSALGLILDDLDLTIEPRDPWLLITTLEEVETQGTIVHYPVWDLVKSQDSEDLADADYDTLIELITTAVKPESWEEVGGAGTIAGYNGILALAQTAEVHRGVSQLMDSLRMLPASQDATVDTPPRSVCAEPKWKVDLRKKLKTKVNLEFEGVNLDAVVDQLETKLNIPMILNRNYLDQVGIDPESPVNCKLREAELGASLAMLLRRLDLTFILKNEHVFVTAIEESEVELESRAYPVAGLLVDLDEKFPDYDSLVELIVTTVSPETWEEVGGTGSIATFPNRKCVVVSQTYQTHKRIEAALLDLYEKFQDPNGRPKRPVATKPEDIVTHIYRIPTGVPEPLESKTPSKQDKTRMTLNPKHVLSQFGGGSMGGGAFGGYRLGGMELKPIVSETLSDLIVATVSKGTWGVDDAKIIAVPDRLYVRCRHDIHEKIQKLLDDLRIEVLNPYGAPFYSGGSGGCGYMGTRVPGGGGLFNVDDQR